MSEHNSDIGDTHNKINEENVHGQPLEKAIELFIKTLNKHMDRKLTSHKREML